MPEIKQLSTAAGRLRCQLSFTSNGEAARTCKVRAIARTSEPVEVPGWFGDRLVHDLSGYRLRKTPLPMLYNHGGNVIGEWSRLEIDGDGNLRASGVVKSVSEGDLAGELVKKLEAGLPFEASINFADEMEISEVPEGGVAECNGRTYAGPLTVCRRYFIREISLCPLGADPLTSTNLDADADPKQAACLFSATVRPRAVLTAPDAVAEEPAPETAPAPAEDKEKPEKGAPETPEREETPEAKPAEAEAVEAGEAVEGEQERKLSVAQLKQWSEEFGEKLAVEWSLEGLDEGQARARFNDHLKAELAKSQELIHELSKQRPGPQVDFIPSDDAREAFTQKAKQYERAGMSPGEAAFAAKHFKP